MWSLPACSCPRPLLLSAPLASPLSLQPLAVMSVEIFVKTLTNKTVTLDVEPACLQLPASAPPLCSSRLSSLLAATRRHVRGNIRQDADEQDRHTGCGACLPAAARVRSSSLLLSPLLSPCSHSPSCPWKYSSRR